MSKRKINIAMIGYDFMGRTHSNAWRQVGRFFEGTPFDPVLKVVVGRTEAKAGAMTRSNLVQTWRSLWDLYGRALRLAADLRSVLFRRHRRRTTCSSPPVIAGAPAWNKQRIEAVACNGRVRDASGGGAGSPWLRLEKCTWRGRNMASAGGQQVNQTVLYPTLIFPRTSG
jgi:hypothetical protein